MSEVAKLEATDSPVGRVSTAALPELFIINLCASMTPMPAVPKSLKGFEKYKLYQVSRQEDGRRRFRLRLGFFTSEADAEWVLNSVRNLYPAAFTGCLSQEDLRYASEALPVQMPVIAAPVKAEPVAKVTPIAKPMPAATPASKRATPVATPPAPSTVRMPAPQPKQDFTLAAASPRSASSRSTPRQTAADAPAFHVARGVDIPETNLELTDEYPSLPPAAATPQVKPPLPNPNLSAKPAAAIQPAVPTGGPIRSASVVNPPKVIDDYVPILDTTLTIRTLTKTEADDPNRPKWFVVQLALSEQPINLDTMPKLDIFAAYSLYSVALMENGGIRHALRLGFFRENVSAEAVMGYLKAFFPAPTINQISVAEHGRFAESKPKVKPATSENVVKLNDKRPTTAPAPGTPTQPQAAAPHAHKPAHKPTANNGKSSSAKPRASAPPAMRPQSFLSRLIGRQLD